MIDPSDIEEDADDALISTQVNPTMARNRKNRKKLSYGALEQRKMLAGNSAFFLDPATSTLQIVACETEVEGAPFASEMSFSIDASTNELVVTEANAEERRFDAALVGRISYRGTFGDDLFTNNTDIPARVVGFAGDDVITSGGGDDVVIGANGDDFIFPGNGNDFVAGGQGDDVINELDSSGEDRFFGGPGADTISSGSGEDYVAGHEGDDVIRTGAENDIAFGHEGVDEIFGGSGRDFIYGGDGDDVLQGELGLDRILGQDGADTISGGEDDDSILGGTGNDTIDGDAGNDRLVGFLGNDILRGGTGADTIISGTAASNGNNFGFDTVESGDDTDVDFIVAHPGDAITVGSEDSLANTEIIRQNLQTRFLDQNINNPGWQETSTGLQYRTVISGTGDSPTAADTVRVNYVGTFIDGVEFDSRDNISFALDRVIAGWTEGLQLVSEGGTIELALPASLGYGEFGIPGVPGNSTLLFRVDLLEVV